MNRQERLVRSMAPLGGLFLLLTLPELRKQGLTYLAVYALERTIEESKGLPVSWLATETGLSDPEISKACNLLRRSGLVRIVRAESDGRRRTLLPTSRGKTILAKVVASAAERLWASLPQGARGRRISETTGLLRNANDKLFGPLQLNFFDKDLGYVLPRDARGPSARMQKLAQRPRRQSRLLPNVGNMPTTESSIEELLSSLETKKS